MAGLTLDEFEREIYSTAVGWKWGTTPITLGLTLTLHEPITQGLSFSEFLDRAAQILTYTTK